LLRPIRRDRILAGLEAVTWLRGRDMAEKLPVIIDSRGDNTVVNALRRLLPNLQKTRALLGE